MKNRPNIAISGCLLGENIRYNRSHTANSWVINELSRFVDLTSLCPEMKMGLGVPREEITIEYAQDGSEKLITKKTKKDLTDLAEDTYQDINNSLKANTPNGFVMMRKSPSCGLVHVKSIGKEDPKKVRHVKGFYARSLDRDFSETPKEDSGRLNNIELRENFVRNIFAHFRFEQTPFTIKGLRDFHKLYKYILMEYNQNRMRELGGIAANLEQLPLKEVFDKYKELFFQTISSPPSAKNRYNSLLHVFGYLKTHITAADKEHLIDIFDNYKKGLINYQTPVNLLQFLINKYDIEYLKKHHFFAPYPKELRLNS